eukprot:234644-Chlamydomonas_euryale.AAC.1
MAVLSVARHRGSSSGLGTYLQIQTLSPSYGMRVELVSLFMLRTFIDIGAMTHPDRKHKVVPGFAKSGACLVRAVTQAYPCRSL